MFVRLACLSLKFLLLVACCDILNAKTLIITFNYNTPEFIGMQVKTFRYFIQDAYELVVFSDSPTDTGHQEIVKECLRYGITCIRVPQSIHEYPFYLPLNMSEQYSKAIQTAPSSVRHVHCVQYSLDTLGFDHEGIVLLIDSDMFLVRPLNIGDYMKDCDVAAYIKESANDIKKTSISYFCPALTFLNMTTLPDKRSMSFNNGWVEECSADSGGFTHYYRKDHPGLRIKKINIFIEAKLFCTSADQKIQYWMDQGFNDKEIKFLLKTSHEIQYFIDGEYAWFLHYYGGSNHENRPINYHKHKWAIINEYLQDIMSSNP